MRIAFVADGRSPTARTWIDHFLKSSYEVHLISTFACEPPAGLASFHMVSVAFSGIVKQSSGGAARSGLPVSLRTALRNWAGPLTLSQAGAQLAAILADIKPGLVHAMRIPYEGMLAAAANPTAPLLISVWGNDFTLHARSNPLMAAATRRAVSRADALHADTNRDLRLAADWGFDPAKPSIVLPGNGGVRTEVFHPPAKPPTEPRIINPRGIRSYVRNDVFFRGIPAVLAAVPNAQFDCPAMQGEPEAEGWVSRLGLQDHVRLLPKLTAAELADAYRAAQVMVSPSTHDGTPNSLLEAMATGVYPVCGDLDSIREWITPGRNGSLVDPNDPDALASEIIVALQSADVRKKGADENAKLIAERADYKRNMAKVETFYSSILNV
jgi:glycosyltransferase involved in cell wall biosynthesis